MMTAASPTVTAQREFAQFVARVAHAEAHFFAINLDQYKALPEKTQRGIAHLQAALEFLRTGEFSNVQAVRSAYYLDALAYHEVPAGVQSDSSTDAYARFVAEVGRAHAFLFTMPSGPEEFDALPSVVRRGYMALSRALSRLRDE